MLTISQTVYYIDLILQNGEMKAKKVFCVVAYDISDNHRRNKVIKVLERYGIRVNYSVYECMFTHTQLDKVKDKIAKLILVKEDSVIYYPICIDCFSKIVYQPYRRVATKTIIAL